MLNIPPAIARAYQEAAASGHVPVEQRAHYLRWLRYYLDFCHKYDHDPEVADSLLPFEEKLIEKHQGDWKRQQARRAVALYYRLGGAGRLASEAQAAGALSANRPERLEVQLLPGSADNTNTADDGDDVQHSPGTANGPKQVPRIRAVHPYEEMLERNAVAIAHRSH